MSAPSYTTKTAYLAGLRSAFKRFAPQLGGKLYSKHVGGNIATTGAKKLMMDYAKGGAGFGAVLGGGFGALGAEEGERMKGFTQGALTGAAHGAVGGALSGAINAPLRNLRTHGMASRYGKGIADKTLKDTWRGNLKTMIGRGADKSTAARRAATMEAFAAPATMAADVAGSDAVMGAGMAGLGALGIGGRESAPVPPPGPPPAPPAPDLPPVPPVPRVDSRGPMQTRVASAQPQLAEAPGDAPEPPKTIEPFLVTPFTGTAGKVMTDKAITAVHPRMPDGALRRHVLPALGTAALTIPAIKAVRAYNEREAPNPLDELDLDALKTYFGKQPATHGDHNADRNH